MSAVRRRVLVLAAGGVLATASIAVVTPAASASPAHRSRCGNSALAVTRTYVDGAAGHSYMALIYRNTSGATCTVHGFPGLDAVNGHGHVIAHAQRNGAHVHTVAIRPGHFASASVEWENFNGNTGGSCAYGRTIDTIVANTSRVHHLAVRVSRCGLEVGPTESGTKLYPHYGPAQHYWIKGSTVSDAARGHWWGKAIRELKATNDYSYQVKTLKQLRAFPDTGLTHKQMKKVRADTRELNTFFGTPGLYF
ncbi:DUF4232 domain-containing protein [Jatrophihabitans endophyticus]|uniref:DUF4232 domain-containing protein n=1 Tax=Jatrophihabitans endophyticus TaxID=1206085 RepID=UPI0019F92FAE|nr:DUF4232 domain-containing protein [Jatrophihabitans endophyticus]MBE7189333.1 DUF4232 domain-containing protein [Jatrophihabitans endophyticus]